MSCMISIVHGICQTFMFRRFPEIWKIKAHRSQISDFPETAIIYDTRKAFTKLNFTQSVTNPWIQSSPGPKSWGPRSAEGPEDHELKTEDHEMFTHINVNKCGHGHG